MLANSHRSFLNSCAVETGLSEFHKITFTVLKTDFKKEPKIVSYRNYKNYSMIFFSNLYLINLLKYRYVMKYQPYKPIRMSV